MAAPIDFYSSLCLYCCLLSNLAYVYPLKVYTATYSLLMSQDTLDNIYSA